MSIQNSNLAKYGYDTVVAVTQKALNNTIKTWYQNNANAFTQQVCYFTKDADGNPIGTGKETVLGQTNNVDPLSVPAWSGSGTMPANVKSVVNSDFYFAFQFTPGDPTGTNKFNYLLINPGTQSVAYYLLCTEIQIVFWNPDTKAWINLTQSRANEFNINANINLQNILDNYNLPPAVQAAVTNLGNTDVNVQQLMFDFNSAAINPTTAVPGLDPTSSVFKAMMPVFAECYFNAYYFAEALKLNYTITQSNASTLVPTSMEFSAGALVDSTGNPVPVLTDDAVADLATINYLFSVNGDALPAPAQFNWNWLEDNGSNISPLTPDTDPNADVNLYNGTISINRDAFAKYLDSQLKDYVTKNWFAPLVTPIYTDYGKSDNEDGFLISEQSVASIPGGFQSYNGIPSLSTEDKLVHWTNNQTVTANGKINPANTLKVESYFDIYFGVLRGQASLTQNLEIDVYQTYNGVEYGGPAIILESRDVFVPALDDKGNLLFQKDQEASYYSNIPQNITLINCGDWVETWLQEVTAGSFQELPITLPQQFVFPGGDAFTFQDAKFSNFSDIVCHITYKAES